MKNIRYLMALAIMLAAVGCASAAINSSISMPGGSTADTHGTGFATGYAYGFVYDNAKLNSIQADILAVASVKGIGDASVTTNVPTSTSHTLTEDQYSLTVGAQGVTTASVKGTDAAAHVTSVADIESYAQAVGAGKISNGSVDGLPYSVGGYAMIYSAIGKDWTVKSGVLPGSPLYQLGQISGTPLGIFQAQASADGTATYDAQITNKVVNNKTIPHTITDISNNSALNAVISGIVTGATTIEGRETDDDATLNGVVGASYTGSLQALNGQFGALNGQGIFNKTALQTSEPQIAVIAAYSNATIAKGKNRPQSTAGVINAILVGVQNDGLRGDSLSSVAGTIDGTASALARNTAYNNTSKSSEELKASASKDDHLSADARAIKALDSAGALSMLATGAKATNDTQSAYTQASTYGGVVRNNPGSDLNGSDRAWGEAFIGGNGQWSSWAAKVDGGTLEGRSAVSGNISQNGPQTGFGSGAFLQYEKNGPVYANLIFNQTAVSKELSPGQASLSTSEDLFAQVLGPKAHSLGSSGWDGSGISADLGNLNVVAQVNSSLNLGYYPTKASTQIGDIGAYMWTDGTNDLQFNGITFSMSNPVFSPSGFGTSTGLTETYTPSPTQRYTKIEMKTTQP